MNAITGKTKMVSNAEEFVRSVLEDSFGQKADKKTVREVAERVSRSCVSSLESEAVAMPPPDQRQEWIDNLCARVSELEEENSYLRRELGAALVRENIILADLGKLINPRSDEEFLADFHKKFAKSLEYLAAN